MCAPSPPAPPDYVGAAKAQGEANLTSGLQTASLGNPNITNPYGSQTVTYSPTGPNGEMQPNITQSLTPQAQQTLDAQQRTQTGLANLGEQGLGVAQGVLGTPFQYNGPNIQTSLPGVQQAQTSIGPYGQPQTSLGPYQQANGNLDLSGVAKMPVNAGTTGQAALMARLQPQIDQSDAALRQQLANQGLTAGGEAYNNAARVQGQQDNDLRSQAALYGLGLDMSANQQGYGQALQSGQFGNQAAAQNYAQQLGAAQFGNQAQQQGYGQQMGAGEFANQGIGQNYNQALGAGQFGNTAAAQALQQQLGLYNQPLNEVTALMSGSQIQAPQFQQYQGSTIQAAPIANATAQQGQWAQNLYGQQMGAYNSLLGGLSQLGGAAMFAL